MKLLLLTLLTLTACSVTNSQDVITISTDFLTQILFNVDEDRIPNYLVGVIYNRPQEKSLSAEAILQLFKAGNVTLSKAEEIVILLDVPYSQVFSINGFNYTMETFNWTFTNFYNTMISKLGLTGSSLRTALETLDIDVDRFSAGITFGDPNPWQEFIRGDFSQANLQAACAQAGITLETLWTGARDLFITDMITFEVKDFVQLLLDHNIDQERALIIWEAINVTSEHIYSLPLYQEILANFTARVTGQVALGVLIEPQEVIIHRSIYEIFEEERDLLHIAAQSLVTRTSLNIGIINDTIYEHLIVLRHDEAIPFTNLTVIEVTNENSNLTNCSYVTLQNNNVLVANVPQAIFNGESYLLPRSVVTNVVSGSALICNDTLFGLARGVVNDQIVVDAFSDYVGDGAFGLKMGNFTLGLMLLWIMQYFLF